MIENLKTQISKFKKMGIKGIIGLALLVTLFIGYAGGRAYKTYEIRLGNTHNDRQTLMTDDMKNIQNMAEHSAKELVNPAVYAPKIVKLETFKDSMSGYNLKIETNSFRFTPELVGQQAIQNTGHAQVYVNNLKVGRAYGEWYNIPSSYFKAGENTISVTLNANNHNVWWSKKGTKEARESVVVIK